MHFSRTTDHALSHSIRDWYHLSLERRRFFSELRNLDCDRLIWTVQRDMASVPRGRLRSRKELECLSRAPLPSLDALGTDSEQALQWMFIHRGFFATPEQPVLWRELPTCCAHEVPEGRSDLLVFDQTCLRPNIVELKQGSATDPLTGVILEALYHWTFAVQHQDSFNSLIAEFGFMGGVPRIAIAAPERYFSEVKRMAPSRGNEFQIGMDWIVGLRHAGVVDLDLYTIDDKWLSTGTSFQMRTL